MYKIEQITNDPYQTQSLVLPDGSRIKLTLYFMPMQLSWFIKELSYGDFVLTGLRICNSPNLLHQFKNKINFGIACVSKSRREPMLIDDFKNGESILYILTAAEVQQFEDYLVNG